jgi:plasmid rolling circle replication initiator protein Rep
MEFHDIINEITLAASEIQEVYERLGVNEKISEYYMRLYDERNSGAVRYPEKLKDMKIEAKKTNSAELKRIASEMDAEYRRTVDYERDKYFRLSERVKGCNSYWLFDVYKRQKIRDLQSINFCHNRFCSNCQKVVQGSRMARFIPWIQALGDGKYLYHIVLTVPNCSGENLRRVTKTMFKAFLKVTRYFSGDAKIKGENFQKYGYLGVIRALEIIAMPLRCRFVVNFCFQ